MFGCCLLQPTNRIQHTHCRITHSIRLSPSLAKSFFYVIQTSNDETNEKIERETANALRKVQQFIYRNRTESIAKAKAHKRHTGHHKQSTELKSRNSNSSSLVAIFIVCLCAINSISTERPSDIQRLVELASIAHPIATIHILQSSTVIHLFAATSLWRFALSHSVIRTVHWVLKHIPLHQNDILGERRHLVCVRFRHIESGFSV